MRLVSIRDDVVLRAIHQLIEALLRAAGLRRKKDLGEAQQAVGDGLTSLGLSIDMITRLDAQTLAHVVGPDRRALVGAALLELAAIRAAEGDALAAERCRTSGEGLLDGADIPDELRAVLPKDGEDARMTW